MFGHILRRVSYRLQINKLFFVLIYSERWESFEVHVYLRSNKSYMKSETLNVQQFRICSIIIVIINRGNRCYLLSIERSINKFRANYSEKQNGYFIVIYGMHYASNTRCLEVQ